MSLWMWIVGYFVIGLIAARIVYLISIKDGATRVNVEDGLAGALLFFCVWPLAITIFGAIWLYEEFLDGGWDKLVVWIICKRER